MCRGAACTSDGAQLAPPSLETKAAFPQHETASGERSRGQETSQPMKSMPSALLRSQRRKLIRDVVFGRRFWHFRPYANLLHYSARPL